MLSNPGSIPRLTAQKILDAIKDDHPAIAQAKINTLCPGRTIEDLKKDAAGSWDMPEPASSSTWATESASYASRGSGGRGPTDCRRGGMEMPPCSCEEREEDKRRRTWLPWTDDDGGAAYGSRTAGVYGSEAPARTFGQRAQRGMGRMPGGMPAGMDQDGPFLRGGRSGFGGGPQRGIHDGIDCQGPYARGGQGGFGGESQHGVWGMGDGMDHQGPYARGGRGGFGGEAHRDMGGMGDGMDHQGPYARGGQGSFGGESQHGVGGMGGGIKHRRSCERERWGGLDRGSQNDMGGMPRGFGGPGNSGGDMGSSGWTL